MAGTATLTRKKTVCSGDDDPEDGRDGEDGSRTARMAGAGGRTTRMAARWPDSKLCAGTPRAAPSPGNNGARRWPAAAVAARAAGPGQQRAPQRVAAVSACSRQAAASVAQATKPEQCVHTAAVQVGDLPEICRRFTFYLDSLEICGSLASLIGVAGDLHSPVCETHICVLCARVRKISLQFKSGGYFFETQNTVHDLF